jgi:hypothetical protein
MCMRRLRMRKRASFETEANDRFGYTITGTAISRYKHKDEKFYRKIGSISKISDFSVHQKHKACRCGYILRSAVGKRTGRWRNDDPSGAAAARNKGGYISKITKNFWTFRLFCLVCPLGEKKGRRNHA